MKKLIYKNALLAVIACLIMVTGCKRHDLPSIAKSLFKVSLQPLVKDTSRDGIVFTAATRPRQHNLWRPNSKYHELQSKPKLDLLWRGQPFIHPRGIMLDPDNDALWVSDPGDAELDPLNKPARIIRIPLINGTPGVPKIFYSKPGFLHSAKWALPLRIEGKKVLIVADQGKATSEYTFTGEGAKVFILPVLSDDMFGEPIVLWEEKPFQCPTGVAVIDDYIYITDPCAGPLRHDPKNPGYSFPTSAIFAMPLAAGTADLARKTKPILLQQGEPYTSLIGICPLIPGELIINDTDSGIPDEGEIGRPGFSPPRTADRWVLKIIDPKKPLLSKPVRTTFTEQGDVRLNIEGIPEAVSLGLLAGDAKIRVQGRNGSKIITDKGPVDMISFPISSLSGSNSPGAVKSMDLKVASDVMSNKISLDVDIPKIRCVMPPPYQVDAQKDAGRGNLLANNKHGGAKKRKLLSITTNKNSTGNTIYDRFTLDNAGGHGSVWIYPDAGGSPVAIAIGPPLIRPLGGQLSPNQEYLWFTDQANGSLYSLPFPSGATFDSLYGVQKPIR